MLHLLLANQRVSVEGATLTCRNVVDLPPLKWRWDDVKFRGSVLLLLTSSVLLSDLFKIDEVASDRSLAGDQLEIFHSIERSLSSVGMEGRPCLLRFICELHQHPVGRRSVIGELLTIIFTPKPSLLDVLHDYTEAGERGSGGGDCAATYPGCPLSLLAVMRGGAGHRDEAVPHKIGEMPVISRVQANTIRIGQSTKYTEGFDQDFHETSPNGLFGVNVAAQPI